MAIFFAVIKVSPRYASSMSCSFSPWSTEYYSDMLCWLKSGINSHFGMTRACPLASGPISRKEYLHSVAWLVTIQIESFFHLSPQIHNTHVNSVSMSLKLGISPKRTMFSTLLIQIMDVALTFDNLAEDTTS